LALKSDSDLLRNAKSLISNPERWCQGAHSLRANGAHCLGSDPDAVAWCAGGAVWRIGSDNPAVRDEALRILTLAARETFGEDHLAVNDRLGHAAVMRMLDVAIRLADEKELKMSDGKSA
jgi:hypothetical protein